ncbi:MAG TPA: copper amine oxidase, partial [Clostridiales bacterium]|nr:copper amine oxidase [Clostridiales bacterium]
MKKLCLTITCMILTIVLVGGTTAHAISPIQEVTTFVGNGEFTQEDGAALSASFRMPNSIVTLPDGTVLVSDSSNQVIRSIQNDEVNSYAGITFDLDDYGIPIGAWSDGDKELAVFSNPSGMAADEEGNVYVADAENNRIRKISKDGQVTTIAGDGYIGRKGGDGLTARFAYPQDIAIAKDGTLYVADTLNHTIRKITVEGKVSTLNSYSTRAIEVVDGSAEMAGDYLDGKIKHAKFNEPSGLAIDSKGNLYVSDTGNQLIRYIDFSTNRVTTVAGNLDHSSSISESNAMYATGGYSDGKALEASFNFPKGLSVTKENGVIIADSLNHSIRYLLDGNVYTLAENLHNPTDVAIMQDGSILIADSYNNLVSQLEG